MRFLAPKVNRQIVGGDGARVRGSCSRFAQANTKLGKRAVESIPPDGRDGGVSLPARGEPILCAFATSRRDVFRALCRSLRSPIVATSVRVRLALLCDALFRLVGNIARALRLGYGVPRSFIRFGRFFDRR